MKRARAGRSERLQLGFGEPHVLALGELVAAHEIFALDHFTLHTGQQWRFRTRDPHLACRKMEADVLVFDGWVYPNRDRNW